MFKLVDVSLLLIKTERNEVFLMNMKAHYKELPYNCSVTLVIKQSGKKKHHTANMWIRKGKVKRVILENYRLDTGEPHVRVVSHENMFMLLVEHGITVSCDIRLSFNLKSGDATLMFVGISGPQTIKMSLKGDANK